MESDLVSRLRQQLKSQSDPAAVHRLLQSGRRVAMMLHDPAQEVGAHTRDYVELLCQCCGRGTYRINDRELELDEGELLLLGQNSQFAIPAQSGEPLAVRFVILPSLFGNVMQFLGDEETPLREFLLRCMGQETPYGYLHFRVGGVQEVENLVENLILHLLDRPDSRRAIPTQTLVLLFMILLEQTDRLTIGVREQMAVLQVLKYIELRYPDANLTWLAEVLHCDVSWLSREIHRRTGRTFTEILQERRLTQAAWLLTNTRQKVSDIALSVGYENISYFHRIFAKRFGCSPKKYRVNNS